MIVHEMRRLIVNGTYTAGTTLPRGDELIAKLNVSRTPFLGSDESAGGERL